MRDNSLRHPTSSEIVASLAVDDTEGAYEMLEAFLDRERFWGCEGLVADLFLGYRLARSLCRNRHETPPDPCVLPALCCHIRVRDEEQPAAWAYSLGGWERSWDDEGYASAIAEVRAAIARGDVYQVNLVQHLSAPFLGDPRGLATALSSLRPLAPRPFVSDDFAIVSASPELFLARRGDRLVTAPIKGTRPAGQRIDDPKDAAEHVMIVDLERNDLARVCEPGSVRWPMLLSERALAGVTHLESVVEGRLRRSASLASILAATFPGGSVTGAPKLAAIELIDKLEPVGRGCSMGALGTVQPNGDFELALTIRTFAVREGRIHLWVGGGIVWDSKAPDEIEESWVKARPLLAALGASNNAPAAAGSQSQPDHLARMTRARRAGVTGRGLGSAQPDRGGGL